MGLLKTAVNEQAYIKAGIFGGPGTGKTTTASYLAMAIAKNISSTKPVAFFDTEGGSDYLIPKFKTEGLELVTLKSRAFLDLLEVGLEAEKNCSCLIVDSVSHVWQDLCDAKLSAINKFRLSRKWNKLEKLEFQHWADIKKQWSDWTTFFLNSNLHIIVCGRAGGIWEFDTNEETGKKELNKVGTKMKVEGDFGYEPSLLLEMARVQKGAEAGSGWKHCAYVLKDKTDNINGLKFEFEKPRAKYKAGDWAATFKPFKPVFEYLNLGGEQKAFDPNRNSEELFPIEGGSDGLAKSKRAEIALEEIEQTIVAIYPGQDQKSKQLKIALLEGLFATRSWKSVECKRLDDLEQSLGLLQSIEADLKSRTDIIPEQLLALLQSMKPMDISDNMGEPEAV